MLYPLFKRKDGKKHMRNRASITKYIAAFLCIITMTLSFNIYLSFKDLYISNNLPRDSIMYIAAKTSSKNSTILTNNPSIQTDEITKIKSEVYPYQENAEKKIFINILILFLSFISLASIHNFVLCTESNKGHNSKNLLNSATNKTHSINSTPSKVSKEGVH